MKTNKILLINQVETPIVSDSLVLEMAAPGRAIFAVQGQSYLQGLVQYYLGTGKDYELYFTGYIEKCQQVDDKQQRLTCRELPAVLAARLQISLRHPNIEDVLKLISEKTALEFILEEKNWNKRLIPCVYNNGTGYSLLDFLGPELQISNYIWLPQPSGQIYVGSWEGCPLAKMGTIKLPINLTKEVSSSGLTLQIIPKLRPGIRIQLGNSEPVYITNVKVSGDLMRVNYNKAIK